MTLIEMKGVGMAFTSSCVEVRALMDISLSFDRGQFTIIKGPSGSGKTTLLSILGCLLSPSSGSVTIFGDTTAALSKKEMRALRLDRIGFVFQDFNLLEALSVEENVAISSRLSGMSKAQASKKSRALLERVGLDGRLGFLPKELSQGEKQRVAIARALVNNPDIIIGDEPTANLDSKTGQDIIALMREFAADKAVIVATHDERISQMADKVILLEDGKIVGSE
jgi:putative ABC transport system ATP-binding protein